MDKPFFRFVSVISGAFKNISMLSVNIPVFNIEVGDLVSEIANQARALAIGFEIKIYDDGSQEHVKQQNRNLKEIEHVKYLELERNIGRAAIRNKMGLESDKKYLLFIDADSKIVSDDYLQKYIEQAKTGIVICGGTVYSANKPSNEKMLRWVYGHQREAISSEKRNSQKGFIITSNNFLIDRELFRKVHFRENLGPYGHEDTLLGFDLFNTGITPTHIDNPVEHTGLEDSKTFLNKTKEALKNLLFISENLVSNSSEFNQKMRFLKHYRKITSIIPPFLLRWLFRLFQNAMEKNLTGRNLRLFCFDLYKLMYFAELQEKEKALTTSKS
jgi:glycosyltransferase involved in cell wall biosynthesis